MVVVVGVGVGTSVIVGVKCGGDINILDNLMEKHNVHVQHLPSESEASNTSKCNTFLLHDRSNRVVAPTS